MRPRPGSASIAAVLTGLCYAVFFIQLLHARQWDVSRFVIAGGPGVDARAVPPGLTVLPGSGGYDGGAFYRLALDPFTHVAADYGITLDNPAYRQQRIVYPLLVWMLSLGGQPRIVPWILVVANLIALTVMAALAARLCETFGVNGLWGLAIPLFPGFLWSLARDLSEIIACTFALAAILVVVRRQTAGAVILLSLAVLTRETTLTIALALGCVYVVQRILRRRPAIAPAMFLIPIAVYVAGQIVLAAVWGEAPVNAGRPGVGLPFAEFVKAWEFAWPREIRMQRLYFVQCVFLIIEVALALYVSIGRRPMPQWAVAWAGNLTIAAVFVPGDWVADIVFLRILADLHLLSGVVILTAGPRAARAVFLAATAALWLHLARFVVALG